MRYKIFGGGGGGGDGCGVFGWRGGAVLQFVVDGEEEEG